MNRCQVRRMVNNRWVWQWAILIGGSGNSWDVRWENDNTVTRGCEVRWIRNHRSQVKRVRITKTVTTTRIIRSDGKVMSSSSNSQSTNSTTTTTTNTQNGGTTRYVTSSSGGHRTGGRSGGSTTWTSTSGSSQYGRTGLPMAGGGSQRDSYTTGQQVEVEIHGNWTPAVITAVSNGTYSWKSQTGYSGRSTGQNMRAAGGANLRRESRDVSNRLISTQPAFNNIPTTPRALPVSSMNGSLEQGDTVHVKQSADGPELLAKNGKVQMTKEGFAFVNVGTISTYRRFPKEDHYLDRQKIVRVPFDRVVKVL